MKYKKIAVIGISSSGKSTFSRRLSEIIDVPLYHMDALFWKGNWEAVPEKTYLQEHESLIQKPEWIVEGYVDKKMSSRLRDADLVLYLDYSGVRCAWWMIRRWFAHRKESRPELPKEALEKFHTKFFWLILTRGERKDIESAIEEGKPRELRRFHFPRELEEFVNNYLTEK